MNKPSVLPLSQAIPHGAEDRERHLREEIVALRERLKQAEAARQETEDRFHAFLDNSPCVAFLKSAEGHLTYTNRRFREIFQVNQADVLGTTDFERYPADIARQLRENDRQVLAADGPIETIEHVPTPDGVLRSWLAFKFPVPVADGRRILGGVAVDITARIAAEERLQEYATRLQTLSRRLLEVQEQERRHLARELHDEVGQALTGLKLVLEMKSRLPPTERQTGIDEARVLVQELIGRVRDLSLDLRPTLLDDLGLVPALSSHFKRYTAQTRVQVHFAPPAEPERFRPEVETTAYRIIQEALTNVARHAGVNLATVGLWRQRDCLLLRVSDEGAGFDPGAAWGSSGLSGMQERAALLGGRLSVESAPGMGTRLTAELPVLEVAENTSDRDDLSR